MEGSARRSHDLPLQPSVVSLINQLNLYQGVLGLGQHAAQIIAIKALDHTGE